MAKITKTFQYGGHQVTLETGEIARQASGAVVVKMDDTVVLVSAVAAKSAREGQDFFPLTVDYQEKFYAGGRIPGGFFKREGRPTEKETLISRLIDRPIRPLFPEDYKNEVQIIATVMSMNPEIDGDIPALIGASAALALAGTPFQGPIGAAKVGYKDGQYILNPTAAQLAESELELVVAGTSNAVLMVESEAKMLSEDVMLGAVMFGHREMQKVINAINELTVEAGAKASSWVAPAKSESLIAAINETAGASLAQAYQIRNKAERREAISAIRKDTWEQLSGRAEAAGWQAADYAKEFGDLEYTTMRNSVLSTKVRIDGRDLDAPSARSRARPACCRAPTARRCSPVARRRRSWSSTLGTARDGQIIDAVSGEYKENFLFHYNFPPYSVGETGRFGAPKRREIGHGRLAKRGVLADDADAGSVPVHDPRRVGNHRVERLLVDGLGLRFLARADGRRRAGEVRRSRASRWAWSKEGDNFVGADATSWATRTTSATWTSRWPVRRRASRALQMDIKIQGITEEIMKVALAQAKEGRLHILGEMAKAIEAPRGELSEFAPRLLTMKIHPDKIREVIGKGGSTIQAITKETGTQIDIQDDGTIVIASVECRRRRRPPRRASSRSPRTSSRAASTKARSPRSWTSVRSSRSCRARTVWSTSRRSPASASRRSPTSSRKATP